LKTFVVYPIVSSLTELKSKVI